MTAHISISLIERIFPNTRLNSGQVVPLSLLDATTANYIAVEPVWLFERPERHVRLAEHLSRSLRYALDAYPQWCGQLKSIDTLDGAGIPLAANFPPHARRLGRLYTHFGIAEDPGVAFITASSDTTLDILHPANRTQTMPIWQNAPGLLKPFIPHSIIAHTMGPNEPDASGVRRPLVAIQVTTLACGGFVLGMSIPHPIADIACVLGFVRDWACANRALICGGPLPQLSPVFDPVRLDALALGDINGERPDAEIVRRALQNPMHRYDSWVMHQDTPRSLSTISPRILSVPEVLRGRELVPAGKPMPWHEYDADAPVSSCVIHLTRAQVDYLWKTAMPTAKKKFTKHDVIVAHLWSCICRARRGLHDDDNDADAVHCDLALSLRPIFREALGSGFGGAPIVVLNVEVLPAARVAAAAGALGAIAEHIRETVVRGSDKGGLRAHLHGVAFEATPQRIWQTFPGRRHFQVTSWARVGLYEVDFGVGAVVRYADGLVVDGALIRESKAQLARGGPGWADGGVDVSICLGTETLERMLRDPLLLPGVVDGVNSRM